MQWIIFGILAAVVISGVRRMAKEAPGSGINSRSPFTTTTQAKPASQAAIDVQDTVQCSTCNAFMVKNAPSCGREGCPYGK